MPETLSAAVGLLVPIAIGVAAVAIVVGVGVWLVRRARRSPRARAAAAAARTDAGREVARLDDTLDALDVETSLTGALHDARAPTSLRRASMSAQHVRDDAFLRYDELSDPAVLPPTVRRRAARLQTRAAAAAAAVGRARVEHGVWAEAHVTPAEQVGRAEHRLTEWRETLGDPHALVRDLSARFDESEWQDASTAATNALAATQAADQHLAAAHGVASGGDALPDLAAAERCLRRAQRSARTLEETHRLVRQCAEALPDEFDTLRTALQQALTTRRQLPPDGAESLEHRVREIEASIDALRADAARRPAATVTALARLRESLDLAVAQVQTAQQRLRSARTALPGTVAAARGAVARAEASEADTGIDGRVRSAAAQRHLAATRTSSDPVSTLREARQALRDADRAVSLATADTDREPV